MSETGADQVFARIAPRPVEGNDRVFRITMDRIYETYAQKVILDATRSHLTQLSIDRIMRNREQVGEDLTRLVRDRLKSTPIDVIQFGLADVQPPSIIIEANELAKQREIQIEQAVAEKNVAIEKANARKEIAERQQEIDLIEAKTQVLVQRVLDKSVSPAFIMQRYLKFLNAAAASGNNTFVPIETLQSTGLQFRVFSPNFGQQLSALTEVTPELDEGELEGVLEELLIGSDEGELETVDP